MYAVIRHDFNDKTSSVVKVYRTKELALSCLEKIVYDYVTLKDGESRVTLKPLEIKPKQKWEEEESKDLARPRFCQLPAFIKTVAREHSQASHLWADVPIENHFIVRNHGDSLYKLTVYYKYLDSGYLYNSWSTKKVFSVDIVKLSIQMLCDSIGQAYETEENDPDKFFDYDPKSKIEDALSYIRIPEIDSFLLDLISSTEFKKRQTVQNGHPKKAKKEKAPEPKEPEADEPNYYD